MNKRWSLVFFRFLAFAHGMVAFVPLLFNVFFGGLLAGGAWWMPVRGISVGWLLVIAFQLLLPLAWAAWFLVLAFRLWRPTPRLVAQLLWTHLIVLLLGGLHCYWGVHAIRAAERSAAAGGGLMGPIAFIPLILGVPLVVFALISLFGTYLLNHREPHRR